MALKCCDISAGRLRHEIVIERKASVPDGVGGVELVWVTLVNMRAAIEPVSGAERWQAQRIQAQITHSILFRWFDGLRASDRINFKGRHFNITYIRNLEERNRYYQLSAVEGVAQ